MPLTEEGCLCRKCLRAEIDSLLTQAGQCALCVHAQRLVSKGGSPIYLCGLAKSDERFAKFPRLPMKACPGYKPASTAARP